MFKDRDELIESVLKDEPQAVVEGRFTDYNKIQDELTFLKSMVRDLEQGNWPVTEKKLHDAVMVKAKNLMKLLKSAAPKG